MNGSDCTHDSANSSKAYRPDADHGIVTRHLLISGRVQGIWFRDSMRREARRLGISGWVRNLRDGRVEATIQGRAADVTALIAWSRKGPPEARVDGIEIREGHGCHADFIQRPTP